MYFYFINLLCCLYSVRITSSLPLSSWFVLDQLHYTEELINHEVSVGNNDLYEVHTQLSWSSSSFPTGWFEIETPPTTFLKSHSIFSCLYLSISCIQLSPCYCLIIPLLPIFSRWSSHLRLLHIITFTYLLFNSLSYDHFFCFLIISWTSVCPTLVILPLSFC